MFPPIALMCIGLDLKYLGSLDREGLLKINSQSLQMRFKVGNRGSLTAIKLANMNLLKMKLLLVKYFESLFLGVLKEDCFYFSQK